MRLGARSIADTLIDTRLLSDCHRRHRFERCELILIDRTLGCFVVREPNRSHALPDSAVSVTASSARRWPRGGILAAGAEAERYTTLDTSRVEVGDDGGSDA